MEENSRKNGIIKVMTEVEYYPSIQNEKINIEKYAKLPIANLAALGVAFEPLAAAFQNIVLGSEATSGILRFSIPKGGHLANFKDGSGMLGTVLDGENKLMGQARLNPLACDPTMLFMAAALANIEKKLDDILETQKEILGFLEQKEKSVLKGNLNYLTDILNSYKYNWNNEKYKNSNHIKVLDIKQNAEQSIIFHQEQIKIKIAKNNFFHSNQDVKSKMNKLESEFNDYQLALYLYSFSSYLEVLLLENFESIFLDRVVHKIEVYSFQYREFYTKCYNQIDGDSRSSIEAHLLKGLAVSSKAVGDAIAKVPLINRSQFDESLIESSSKFKKIGSKMTGKTLKQFINKQSSNVRPFIDNINTINKLHNQPMDLLVDQENIYIRNIDSEWNLSTE